jgi:DNA relaxase NicK
MLAAFAQGYNFGSQVIDTHYLNIIDNQFTGTLGIGSRRSSLFVRIYTEHKPFVRWESELKHKKAQRLFEKLAALGNDQVSGELPVKDILKTLVAAALDNIDFRDKSNILHPKNATRKRTEQLPFWNKFLKILFSAIEDQNIDNYLK